MAALAQVYGQMLARAPALTKYCTTFWICAVSVYISQRISDTVSLKRIVSYSAVVGAPPYSHYWFLLLERMRVGSTTSMVLDQVLWRPITIAWSFVVGAYLNDGSLKNLGTNLREDFLKSFRNGLLIWVPASLINFRYVPSQWRVLFIDLVHFFWDIYLCTITMSKKKLSAD